MEIPVLVGNLVQIKKSLVDRLLQLKGRLHSLLAAAPTVLGRLLDVLKHDAATAVVLEFHERLGVFQLFARGLAEVFSKARKSNIVALEVVRL